MKAGVLVALVACSGGNGREGEFYGLWTLISGTDTNSCSGALSLGGTMSITSGTTEDLGVTLRDWPPCTSGIELDVDGNTASGSVTCIATVTGSDGSTGSIQADVENLTLDLDSTGMYLSLSGKQTQTDAGSSCDLVLAGSAYKPGVINN